MEHMNIQEQSGEDLLDVSLCDWETVEARKADIEFLLKKAVDRSWTGLTVEEILRDVRDEKLQLWVIFYQDTKEIIAVLTTEIVAYSNNRLSCFVVTLSGEGFSLYKHKIAEIEDWAAEQGCTAVEVFSRRGFTKYLARLDYVESYVVLRKELHPIVH